MDQAANLIKFLDGQIDTEKRSRRRLVERLLIDILESVDREADLLRKRAEAAVASPSSEPNQTQPSVRGRYQKGAGSVILEILNEAGAEGLLGSKLTEKASYIVKSKNTIEKVKQRLKEDNQVTLHDGIWRLRKHTPAILRIRPRA